MRVLYVGLLLGLVLLAASCTSFPSIPGLTAASPHERYAASLADAGLDRSVVGRAWLAAADSALADTLVQPLPLREARFFDPAVPEAASYVVSLQRGQELRLTVTPSAPDSLRRWFVDVYRLDPPNAPRVLDGLVADDTLLVYETTIDRTARYLVRVQPEVLAGGRVDVTLEAGASLATFPVVGYDSRAVQSRFGVARDGGRRRHEGIDIFAPRGTPAVAALDGVVSRVDEGGLGGKYVFMRGSGLNLYYAHLDSQLVRVGQPVQAGDTLGLVGNTGNARTTPPHLHFGIYAGGAVDPYPFVDEPTAEPPTLRADLDALGTTRRTRAANRTLYAAAQGARRLDRLAADVPVRVLGGSAARYRVALPDGRVGFVDDGDLEALTPTRRLTLESGSVVVDRLWADAVAVDSLSAGSTVAVLGAFGPSLFVEGAGGRRGWWRSAGT